MFQIYTSDPPPIYVSRDDPAFDPEVAQAKRIFNGYSSGRSWASAAGQKSPDAGGPHRFGIADLNESQRARYEAQDAGGRVEMFITLGQEALKSIDGVAVAVDPERPFASKFLLSIGTLAVERAFDPLVYGQTA